MAETCEGTHDMWRAPAARARLGGTRRPSKVAEVTGWRRVITEYMVFPSLYLKKQVKCQTLLTCFEQEIKGVCRRVRTAAPSGNGLGIHGLEEARAFVKF
ncbi:uncharacterized protein LJ206_007356 isoform 2-T2 [Theristicus caerulescens]